MTPRPRRTRRTSSGRRGRCGGRGRRRRLRWKRRAERRRTADRRRKKDSGRRIEEKGKKGGKQVTIPLNFERPRLRLALLRQESPSPSFFSSHMSVFFPWPRILGYFPLRCSAIFFLPRLGLYSAFFCPRCFPNASQLLLSSLSTDVAYVVFGLLIYCRLLPLRFFPWLFYSGGLFFGPWSRL